VSERWTPLRVKDCDRSPFVQFNRWFDEARDVMPEREAITVASVARDGRPSARMVLLRHVDDYSFGWYTNYRSQKGVELLENPHCALLWYCEPLGRQVRIEGVAEKMLATESDAYFNARPRGHQVGALASHQSEPLASRELLEERVRQVEQTYADRAIERPEWWGGFRLIPDRFEFWQHRQDRLHDRVVYAPDVARWSRVRYSP
jgi:pyridoxamine 5'-phosphate oxidase